MSWLALAILTAVTSSLRDVFVRFRSQDLGASELALAQYILASILIGSYALNKPMPPLTISVMLCAVFAGVSVGVGTLLFFTALQKSELSLMIPLRAITPVLLLIFSALLLSEKMNWFGASGVCVIAVGLFVVNNPRFGPQVFSEFAHAEGTPYMLGGALVFSLCAISEKTGIVNSEPIFFTALESIFATATLLGVSRWRGETLHYSGRHFFFSFLPIGLLFSIMMTVQALAYAIGPISYVASIKRSGTILTVILGCLLLKEGGFRRRFLGCSIVVAGAVLIAIKG